MAHKNPKMVRFKEHPNCRSKNNFSAWLFIQTFKGLESHGVTEGQAADTPAESGKFSDFFRTPRMRARTLNLFYQVTISNSNTH